MNTNAIFSFSSSLFANTNTNESRKKKHNSLLKLLTEQI